ncbi:MAG TPA: MCE family protein, partial [Mycobacteriales bacterium]|nr:MCE family protein [Mycobacteriales bacterium]
LQADRLGNQLTPPADVKLNGVIVGEARSVEATADGARITLALDPDRVDDIPNNVEARLLPKTLFGEKFVSLVLPETPSGQVIAAGDVIPQDRSSTAREFGTALDNLLPLLETLEPETLSTTLNAVSSSLRGRGDRIGDNLVLVRDYFEQFNPELPRLQENLRGTADFADNVSAATPDILSLLDDLSAINRNLVRDEAAIDRVLRETAGVAATVEDFVRENEERFVQLAAEGRGPLELFAKYAPEYPCLAEGIAESDLFIGDSFGRLQPGLHITLEVVPQREGYQPGQDEPEYLDRRGPDCWGLPDPKVPAGDDRFADGYDDDTAGDPQTYPGDQPEASTAAFAPAGFSGAAQERRVINAVVAPVMGVHRDEVPDVVHLLFGPVARGTVVGLEGGAA